MNALVISVAILMLAAMQMVDQVQGKAIELQELSSTRPLAQDDLSMAINNPKFDRDHIEPSDAGLIKMDIRARGRAIAELLRALSPLLAEKYLNDIIKSLGLARGKLKRRGSSLTAKMYGQEAFNQRKAVAALLRGLRPAEAKVAALYAVTLLQVEEELATLDSLEV